MHFECTCVGGGCPWERSRRESISGVHFPNPEREDSRMAIAITAQDVEAAKNTLAQAEASTDQLFNSTNTADAQLIALAIREAGIRIALATMQAAKTN
jgi:hypothetical protein